MNKYDKLYETIVNEYDNVIDYNELSDELNKYGIDIMELSKYYTWKNDDETYQEVVYYGWKKIIK